MDISMNEQLKITSASLQYTMECVTKLARIVSRVEAVKSFDMTESMAMQQITEILDEPSDIMRRCKADGCDVIFKPSRIDHIYCSDRCKWKQHKRDTRKAAKK
jgi:hypothetical protein